MPRPPKTPTPTKTPTSEERRAATQAMRETLDDLAIGRALNLSQRQIRRDAGPRSPSLPAASEPVETEDERGRPCIVVEAFGDLPPAKLRRAEAFALLEAGRR
jgi:predicted DNA-binding transcriptional regulator YafY